MYEELFQALEDAGVRYVVVGGLAVVLHGFARLTADVDLVVDLAPAEAVKAVDALTRLGFQPRPPADPRGFADPAIRKSWLEEKGMRVFSFYDPGNPMRNVDLFARHPIPFEELWARSESVPLSKASVRLASIADLIRLKREAGRPQDLIDIEALERIQEAKRGK